ncbi:MAG: diguanylate cyclase (GGDEF)-like protein [Candidatus Endobugula sp.]|jgi:diguanylate cyclase (GGDEF)-like protein
MLDAILDSLSTHVVVINRSGLICYVNDAWKQFANKNGMANNDINWLEYNYLDVCRRAADDNDDDATAVLNGLESVMKSSKPSFGYEYPCHSLKEKRWYFFNVAPLKDQADHYVISHHSVTENKLILQQAERLSLEDPLTGLYNRRGLESLMTEELSRAKRNNSEMSFVVFDVDHFKLFNDCFGHIAGDQCLQDIAQLIKTQARRPGDIAARIGGDEFVLVLTQVSSAQAQVIVDSVCRKVDELNMTVDAYEQVAISAGIATSVPKCDASDLTALYRQADQALYVAKGQRPSANTA